MKITIDTHDLSPEAQEMFEYICDPPTGTLNTPEENMIAILNGFLGRVRRDMEPLSGADQKA